MLPGGSGWCRCTPRHNHPRTHTRTLTRRHTDTRTHTVIHMHVRIASLSDVVSTACHSFKYFLFIAGRRYRNNISFKSRLNYTCGVLRSVNLDKGLQCKTFFTIAISCAKLGRCVGLVGRHLARPRCALRQSAAVRVFVSAPTTTCYWSGTDLGLQFAAIVATKFELRRAERSSHCHHYNCKPTLLPFKLLHQHKASSLPWEGFK